MEPQVEAWKGPMSDCQTGKTLTCELPDREAPNNNTETGMMDWGDKRMSYQYYLFYM